MKFHFLFFLIITLTDCLAQQNLIIVPQNPQHGELIQLQYNSKNTPLSSSLVVSATAYIYEKTGRSVKAVEVLLDRKDNLWFGQFYLPKSCVAFALNFQNEKGIPDCNNGKGYVYPVKDDKGNNLQGANAIIARNYAIYSNRLKIEPDMKLAKSMFGNAFEENQELKKYFIFPYHYTFDLNDSEERLRLISELDLLYANRHLLDEFALKDLQRVYKKLGLIEKAEKCLVYILKEHPDGQIAFQKKSLSFQQDLHKTNTLKVKMKAYNRIDQYFKEKLEGEDLSLFNIESLDSEWQKKNIPIFSDLDLPTTNWLENKKYSNTIRIISLMNILRSSKDKTSLDIWLELVEQTEDNYAKMILLDHFAKEALKRNTDLQLAQELSSKAVAWGLEHLETPRSYRELTFLSTTDDQLKINRKIKYANFLITKAELLQRMGENQEAFEVCNQAITFSNLIDQDLNQRIVGFLINSKKEDDAKEVIRLAISKGKATSKMEKLLFKDKIDNVGNDSLTQGNLMEKRKYLAAFQTNTPALDFELPTLSGDTITLQDLKGKIVILDFWASWCAACIASFPAFQEVVTKHMSDPNIVFLFINLDSKEGEIRSEISDFLIERKYDFEVLLDGKGMVAQSYAISSLPTKIVIDQNGMINFRNTGVKKSKEEMIDELSLMIEMAK